MQLHLAVAPVTAVAPIAADTSVEGVIDNTGTEPVVLDWVELSSASIALELVDGNGVAVPMLPPPTPGRPETVLLQPGERRSTTFVHFMPPGSPPGRYRLRLRYRDAVSAWVVLDIR